MSKPKFPDLPESYRWLVEFTEGTGEVHVCIVWESRRGYGTKVEARRTIDPRNFYNPPSEAQFDTLVDSTMRSMAEDFISVRRMSEWVKKWQ